jgi:type I restriction enzyme R subunit
VLTDEAHRTQYGGLAANMRKALPNAAFFGFTGTPIDKKDRSTLTTFGPTSTPTPSSRLSRTAPRCRSSTSPPARAAHRRQHPGRPVRPRVRRPQRGRARGHQEEVRHEATIAGAPKRVEAICLDLVTHFTQFIRPNGFKAQVVTCSREIAVLYKETLDRLNAPQSAVIISGRTRTTMRWSSTTPARSSARTSSSGS